MYKKLLTGMGLASLASVAMAAEPFFTELLVNPPGTDDTFESVEIQGDPNFDFSSKGGYYMVVIEGDGTPAGIIDVVVSLSGKSAGSNGLLLIRDNVKVLNPNPDPATTVWVNDFVPDIENGTQTYVLGYGDAPRAVGTDLDTNNDGVLDLTISAGNFTVVDTFAYDDNDNTDDFEYGAALGGTDFGVLGDGVENWTPEAMYRVLDSSGTMPAGWGFMRISATVPEGPYSIRTGTSGQRQQKGLDTFGINLETFTLDLGIKNQKAQSATETVKPSAFNIVFGSLVSGGVGDVGESDDSRLVVNNGQTFLITQSPITVEFTGTATTTTPSKIDFVTEAQVSLGGLTQRVDMFDYVAGSFEQVDERPGSVGNDQVVTVTKTSGAANYIGSGGEVKMRYRVRDDTPAFLVSWQARIDKIVYILTK